MNTPGSLNSSAPDGHERLATAGTAAKQGWSAEWKTTSGDLVKAAYTGW